MKSIARALLLVLLLSACGCVAQKEAPATGTTSHVDAFNPREMEVTAGVPASGPEISRIAARGYYYTKEHEPWGYGAYAYVVFNADPRSVDTERAQVLCDIFKTHLPAAVPPDAQRELQMVTLWPLKGEERNSEPDCSDLISQYDIRFGARVSAAVGKQGVTGPLLVAWKDPFAVASSKALVFDMSHFANKDLSRALRIWKDRIARNPQVWQQGWKAVLVKEEIRNVIENTAPDAISVIATFLPNKKSE